MAPHAAGKTPIKIPGKRTRSTAKEDVATRKKLNRPPGRPLKFTSSETSSMASDPSTKTRKRPKVRSLKNMKSNRDMSCLERLPTELLQEIFLHCMNLDLPRSSPIIGGKLSSESVYTQTILAAFEDTWETYYRSEKSEISLPLLGNHTLQSSVMRCRWASLPLLLQCQDICMRRRSDQRVFLEPILWFAESEAIERNIQSVVPSTKTVAERFGEDFAAFMNAILGPDFRLIVRYCDPETDCKVRDLAEETEIPHNLLVGPWTEESVRYLYWLIKSGAKLEWITSTSGEAALLGLENAIQAGNLAVVVLLLCAGLVDKLDTTMLIRALHNSNSNDPCIMNYMLAAANLKGMDMYRFASEVEAERDEVRRNVGRKSEQGRLDFLDNIKGTLESYHSGK